jgi:hypothetical protein
LKRKEKKRKEKKRKEKKKDIKELRRKEKKRKEEEKEMSEQTQPQQISQALEYALQRIQELETRLQQVTSQQAQQTQQVQQVVVPPESSRAIKEPKVALPEKFDGNRHKCRHFLNQCELLFLTNPSRYDTDAKKIGLIGSLLTGGALAWLSPFIEKSSTDEQCRRVMTDFATFKKTFQDTFDEADRSFKAAIEISQLFQHDREPASIYASKFRHLASDLHWDNAALIHQFRMGLRNKVKDMLVFQPTPATLEEMIDLAIRCDNRCFENEKEKALAAAQRRSVPTPQRQSNRASPPHDSRPPPAPKPAMPSSHHGPTPMDLDSIQRKPGPLTEAEKKRRRDNNLCGYCGAADHHRKDCPKLAHKNTRSHAQVSIQPAPSSSGKVSSQ